MQPSRGVLIKGYFENMQQIYRSTLMPKCDFTLVKSHFGIGILLYICCIFSKNVFFRTPLEGCFGPNKVMGSYLLENAIFCYG